MRMATFNERLKDEEYVHYLKAALSLQNTEDCLVSFARGETRATEETGRTEGHGERQAEQRAMMHRREAGVRPEGMVGPRPGMPPPPGMVLRIEVPPVRHPGQPGMFIPPERTAYRPRVPGQLSPKTPGAQPGMMGMQPGPIRMPGGPPLSQPPKPPTPGETSPEAEQQHIQYDTWLMRQGEFLEGQVKYLEQQIQKQKRAKKAINARNRQLKKNGQEIPTLDAMALDVATQEQARLQKFLESTRKQNGQHQMLAQEYRSKQQDNNPFSEEFQEREQLEKMRENHGKQIPPAAHLEKQAPRLPQEILRMDDRSVELFKNALYDGEERDYNIRIMVVGRFGVGKTTFTKRLLCQDVDINERNSTDGIDVHVGKCKISLQSLDWTFDPAGTMDDSALKRLAKYLGSTRFSDTDYSISQNLEAEDSKDADDQEETSQIKVSKLAETESAKQNRNSAAAITKVSSTALSDIDVAGCLNDVDTTNRQQEQDDLLMKDLKVTEIQSFISILKHILAEATGLIEDIFHLEPPGMGDGHGHTPWHLLKSLRFYNQNKLSSKATGLKL